MAESIGLPEVALLDVAGSGCKVLIFLKRCLIPQ